jgi:hypothetical protein
MVGSYPAALSRCFTSARLSVVLRLSSDDVRADVEAIRSRGGVVSLEPVDTD